MLVKNEITNFGLISEYSQADCFKATSYDLRLGRQFLRPDHGAPCPSTLLDGQDLVIGPFSSVVVSSHEVLSMPRDVVGKFNLKIRLALRGLFVQMGTQVEPHYVGRVFALLQNITNKEIRLKPIEQSVFAIEFFFTSQAVTEVDPKFQDRKFLEIGDFISSGFGLEGTINSVTDEIKAQVAALNADVSGRLSAERLADLERRVSEATTRVFDKRSLAIGGVGIALLAIFVAVIAPIAATIGFKYWEPRAVSVVDDRLDELSTQLSGIMTEQEVLNERSSVAAEIESLKQRLQMLEGLVAEGTTPPEQEGGAP